MVAWVELMTTTALVVVMAAGLMVPVIGQWRRPWLAVVVDPPPTHTHSTPRTGE